VLYFLLKPAVACILKEVKVNIYRHKGSIKRNDIFYHFLRCHKWPGAAHGHGQISPADIWPVYLVVKKPLELTTEKATY
jgi:hypothetical protein